MSVSMEINGEDYKIVEKYSEDITIPDCFVDAKNKLGKGHGERKLYFGSKDRMRSFYGNIGFKVNCFLLKKDLQLYLEQIKEEYEHPTFKYRGASKFKALWHERAKAVDALEEVLYFSVTDQKQIKGDRGYVNTQDENYALIRKLSLPLVTYVSAMKLQAKSGDPIFYWKLFVDPDVFEGRDEALVFKYNKKTKIKKKGRRGQGKFRTELLEECPMCPITHVYETGLLVASHIKPWRRATTKERVDPKNGFTLTPLYDKLFDRGYITFADSKQMIISKWLSEESQKKLGIESKIIEELPLDDERKSYLEYHRKMIFKG